MIYSKKITTMLENIQITHALKQNNLDKILPLTSQKGKINKSTNDISKFKVTNHFKCYSKDMPHYKRNIIKSKINKKINK